VKEMNNSI